jgi:hypothetical protein
LDAAAPEIIDPYAEKLGDLLQIRRRSLVDTLQPVVAESPKPFVADSDLFSSFSLRQPF